MLSFLKNMSKSSLYEQTGEKEKYQRVIIKILHWKNKTI